MLMLCMSEITEQVRLLAKEEGVEVNAVSEIGLVDDTVGITDANSFVALNQSQFKEIYQKLLTERHITGKTASDRMLCQFPATLFLKYGTVEKFILAIQWIHMCPTHQPGINALVKCMCKTMALQAIDLITNEAEELAIERVCEQVHKSSLDDTTISFLTEEEAREFIGDATPAHLIDLAYYLLIGKPWAAFNEFTDDGKRTALADHMRERLMDILPLM